MQGMRATATSMVVRHLVCVASTSTHLLESLPLRLIADTATSVLTLYEASSSGKRVLELFLAGSLLATDLAAGIVNLQARRIEERETYRAPQRWPRFQWRAEVDGPSVCEQTNPCEQGIKAKHEVNNSPMPYDMRIRQGAARTGIRPIFMSDTVVRLAVR